ncbi:MAG: UvrD-helicase domain-containing protein [Bacteroidetes bacterium]|nr:UvrD-helicase domain-containing protein [Bacteroidota bacterium]
MVDKSYLEELNSVQREAVTNVKGPELVIAGAGSGKTRVLTYRIAHLLTLGVYSNSILALTFTNKAAKEMKERIVSLVGSDASRNLWMGTFHSIFSKILRFEADKLGFTSNYTIYDSADSKSLIKSIIKDLHLDEKEYPVNAVLNRISSAKNNLITADAYKSNAQVIERDRSSNKPEIARIYEIYSSKCKRADAMDFDDLLLNTNILFRNSPEVLNKYQKKFSYILVDEYQDTNFSQYLIVKKLAEKHKNICVVGDDAQSIYSFRGAKIENILNFRNDYPEYKLFKLEQNYRSSQTIVDAANSLIKKNKDQIEKVVFSKKEQGEKIKVVRALTDKEEGFEVASSIINTKLDKHIDYKDFAILYRTNAQSRVFEESFRKFDIPYKIYGGQSFYQRKEIKDLIAYFRLIVNHNDNESFKRIINYPARGIGKTTFTKITLAANNNNLNLWDIAVNAQKYGLEINQGAFLKINNFINFIKENSDKALETSAYDFAYSIAKTSGIINDLSAEKSSENIVKQDNIQELLNAIKDFEENDENKDKLVTLDQYLQNVSLLTNVDNEKEEDFNKVALMTIHSAKGLEFKYVFIVGVEEELFPSHMSTATRQELEEERRLFYVAITRAETQVQISYALNRYKWGVLSDCRPSRFIKDIDVKYLEMPEEESDIKQENTDFNDFKPKFKPKYNYKNKSNASKAKPSTVSIEPDKKFTKLQDAKPKRVADEGFVADDPKKIQMGMNVEHQRFGAGKVISLEGEFPNIKAKVFFQKSGQKELLLKFAKLRILRY